MEISSNDDLISNEITVEKNLIIQENHLVQGINIFNVKENIEQAVESNNVQETSQENMQQDTCPPILDGEITSNAVEFEKRRRGRPKKSLRLKPFAQKSKINQPRTNPVRLLRNLQAEENIENKWTNKRLRIKSPTLVVNPKITSPSLIYSKTQSPINKSPRNKTFTIPKSPIYSTLDTKALNKNLYTPQPSEQVCNEINKQLSKDISTAMLKKINLENEKLQNEMVIHKEQQELNRIQRVKIQLENDILQTTADVGKINLIVAKFKARRELKDLGYSDQEISNEFKSLL
jgi:hypothetical protein